MRIAPIVGVNEREKEIVLEIAACPFAGTKYIRNRLENVRENSQAPLTII